MEKTIIVDGKEIRLRASAGIPRMYRLKFRRDIIQDMQVIQRAVEKAQKGQRKGDYVPIPVEALTMFENVAYLMAKHADGPAVPDRVEDWLDQFGTFSIYAVFPVIQELWAANLQTMSTPVKK